MCSGWYRILYVYDMILFSTVLYIRRGRRVDPPVLVSGPGISQCTTPALVAHRTASLADPHASLVSLPTPSFPLQRQPIPVHFTIYTI